MHTDSLFYRLFQERPALAFDLADLKIPDSDEYRMQAVEVKQTAFRLDGVLLPPPRSDTAPLVFTEAQFQADKAFYARWLASIFLYLYRHRVARPWQAVVVFPERALDPGILPAHAGLIQCGLLHRVYLQDLLDTPALGFNARLARLVVLDQEHAVAEARALAAERETTAGPLETLDLIETILVYKFPRLSREEIRTMLHLPETDLKKTRFYQDVFSEGLEEGRKKGRDEGRREAERALVLRLLTRRCGPLNPDLQARIQALNGEQRGELSEALLDFRSLDDLEAWLRTQ